MTQRTLEFSWAYKERGHEAYALRLLGEIHARQEPSEVEPAAIHHRQALTLTEELGTLYTRTGQREQARAELSTAIGLYRAMDMHFWLPQAEAALAQTGRPGPV